MVDPQWHELATTGHKFHAVESSNHWIAICSHRDTLMPGNPKSANMSPTCHLIGSHISSVLSHPRWTAELHAESAAIPEAHLMAIAWQKASSHGSWGWGSLATQATAQHQCSDALLPATTDIYVLPIDLQASRTPQTGSSQGSQASEPVHGQTCWNGPGSRTQWSALVLGTSSMLWASLGGCWTEHLQIQTDCPLRSMAGMQYRTSNRREAPLAVKDDGCSQDHWCHPRWQGLLGEEIDATARKEHATKH